MKDKLKKYLLPNLPYLFFVYLFDKLCQAVRLAPGLSIVQGFAGMRTLTGSLSFDPQLPDGWDGYAFKIVYRGRLIEVSVSREGTGLKLLSGEALTVMLHGHEVRLSPAEADA